MNLSSKPLIIPPKPIKPKTALFIPTRYNTTRHYTTQHNTEASMNPNQEERIIRRLEAMKRLGVSKSTFADWQNPKSKRYRPDFPQKIQIGINSVGYLESEITAYIAKLADSRFTH